MMASRFLWLRLHRWLALSLGWVLILAGLTGASLIVAKPLDRWANAELFIASGTTKAAGAPPSLAQIAERLHDEFGKQASLSFRFPRSSDETLWVTLRGRWHGTVYLHPQTGQEQGRRGEAQGAFNFLFKLHSSLLLDSTGKALLAWVAMAYLVLLITGVMLWWPKRWPPQWHIEWRKSTLRALFDLHRIGGVVLSLFIAVSVATGAYMAWRPLAAYITMVSGDKPVKPPQLPKDSLSSAGAPTPDTMLQTARAFFPGAQPTFMQLSAKPDRPVRIRFLADKDPHPNGISSVWIDPRDGKVLAVQPWHQLDTGSRAVVVIFPLHTGELGGPLLEAVMLVSGLALGGLGMTGVWLWWLRRRAKTQAHRMQTRNKRRTAEVGLGDEFV
ncbi:MAG: PepSY-associated TM helix domain-containing protein [Ottowia sp.]|uniref:PepSY-associated TM helix domain-containing protein n=1 Tax=Ottowia sp. TaxID=1898956 RepID=UPI003C78CE66